MYNSKSSDPKQPNPREGTLHAVKWMWLVGCHDTTTCYRNVEFISFPLSLLLFPSFPTCPSLNFIPFTLKAVCTHLLLHMFDLYVFDPWSYVPVSTLRLCIFGCIYYRLCSLYYKYLVVAIVGTQTCICLSLANPSSPLSLFLVWLSKPPHANPRTTDLSHWTHRNLNSRTPHAPHPRKDVTWGVVVNDSGINLECCRRGGKRHTQKGNV